MTLTAGPARANGQENGESRPRPRSIAREPSTGARRTYPSGIRENQVGAPGPGALGNPRRDDRETPQAAQHRPRAVHWGPADLPVRHTREPGRRAGPRCAENPRRDDRETRDLYSGSTPDSRPLPAVQRITRRRPARVEAASRRFLPAPRRQGAASIPCQRPLRIPQSIQSSSAMRMPASSGSKAAM